MFRTCLKTCLLIAVCGGCRTTGTAHVDSPLPIQQVSLPAQKEDTGRSSSMDSLADDVELTAGETTVERIEQVADVLPESASLPLATCISLGLRQNPDLIALRQNEYVSSAALGVAQTYPFNPFVQVQATPYQDAKVGGPGSTYHYVLLMQTIQLAHQQQFREAGASSTLNSTRWNIHQTELQNVAQTARLYFNVLYQRGILELARAGDQNNQQMLRTLEKQLEAGQATAADVAIVRVDARSTNLQVRLAKANYETAQRDLKRQLGLEIDSDFEISGDLNSLGWVMPSWGDDDHDVDAGIAFATHGMNRDEIASRAAVRPDVMAAHADIDAARAARGLATAAKTPDVQVGPYYQKTTDGTSFLGFRAQMDLPIINSGGPLERQRIAEYNQRIMVWQQLERRAKLEAGAAWERYEVAVTSLGDEVALNEEPTLPTELENLEEQFIAGEVDLVRVLQARNSILQNRRARLDLLNEVALSAAEVTAMTAIPLEELITTIP